MTQHAALGSFIGARRSVRRYRSTPLERALIERLLVAARQAPSAHNRQPWRFAVIEEHRTRAALASAMGERLRRDRTADGDDPALIEADIARSHARLSDAPAVIVVCLDMNDMDRYPDDRRSRAEYLMAVQSTAMAAQNLLLAAELEGLGACVMCAPLFCPDSVVDVLALPDRWEPQMLVTVGAPAGPGRDRPRRPLSDIAVWRPAGQPAR